MSLSLHVRVNSHVYMLMRILGKENVFADGMAGYAMEGSTPDGLYHCCEVYFRSGLERHFADPWYNHLLLLDCTEPKYWYMSQQYRSTGYPREMPWLSMELAAVARL